MKSKCYECIHRQDVAGSYHSGCLNYLANVTADPHGVKNGWFFWPFNFDPIWLESCSGFEPKDKPNE